MTAAIVHVNRMFRDDEVSEHVNAISKLRGFAVEFEVYGSSFWDGEKRHFIASGNYETLHDVRSDLLRQGFLLTPPRSFAERRFVPAGWDDEVEQEIKMACCRTLNDDYPESMWLSADRVCGKIFNEEGEPILRHLSELLENTFDIDGFNLFELVADLLLARRNISPATHGFYAAWLGEERASMASDMGKWDIFCKDIYGFAYRLDSGEIEVVIDSIRKVVDSRRVCLVAQTGCVATPVFHEKCWYNRNYTLANCRRDFKRKLGSLFDEAFFGLLDEIDGLPIAVDREKYLDELGSLQGNCCEEHLAAWEEWGRQWGLL